MSPRVSVVIPSYNHAKFVRQAIDSVLEQSFQDAEVCITDDGSHDESVEIIRSLNDPRVRLEVFEKNQGAAVATNSAIRRSRGEYVAVLNSDDMCLPERLAIQVGFLDRHPEIGAVFGLPVFIDEAGNRISNARDTFGIEFVRRSHTRHEWLRQFFFHGNCLCHPTAVVRRNVYEKVGLYDPRMANLPDFDMWVRICKSHEIHVLEDNLTAFRLLSAERNMSAERLDTRMRVSFEFFEILQQYSALDLGEAKKVFAKDIEELMLDTAMPYGWWLGELAIATKLQPHKLFALDSMFNCLAERNEGYLNFIRLSGRVDAFREQMNMEVERSFGSAAFGKFSGILRALLPVRMWNRLRTLKARFLLRE